MIGQYIARSNSFFLPFLLGSFDVRRRCHRARDQNLNYRFSQASRIFLMQDSVLLPPNECWAFLKIRKSRFKWVLSLRKCSFLIVGISLYFKTNRKDQSITSKGSRLANQIKSNGRFTQCKFVKCQFNLEVQCWRRSSVAIFLCYPSISIRRFVSFDYRIHDSVPYTILNSSLGFCWPKAHGGSSSSFSAFLRHSLRTIHRRIEHKTER